MENDSNINNKIPDVADENFEDVLKDLTKIVQDAIKNRHENPDDYLPPSTIFDKKQKKLVLLQKKKDD